jgi:hypothetical protein
MVDGGVSESSESESEELLEEDEDNGDEDTARFLVLYFATA